MSKKIYLTANFEFSTFAISNFSRSVIHELDDLDPDLLLQRHEVFLELSQEEVALLRDLLPVEVDIGLKAFDNVVKRFDSGEERFHGPTLSEVANQLSSS